MISLVVAVSENGVIGRRGNLPWHLPDDLRRFKALTSGHAVVMGRRTFESIGKPLPNRQHVVLTRDRDLTIEGVEIAHDLESAMAGSEGGEVFFIGGAEIFREILPRASRLYLTLVHAEVEGEIVFGGFDLSDWDLVEDGFHASDQVHEYPFSFRVYERHGHH